MAQLAPKPLTLSECDRSELEKLLNEPARVSTLRYGMGR